VVPIIMMELHRDRCCSWLFADASIGLLSEGAAIMMLPTEMEGHLLLLRGGIALNICIEINHQ
jgi:hypothetical protein